MAFGSKENKTPVQVPAHIGIIMDGNGRWAKKRGLPRTAGHTAGAQNFRTITRYASSIGVKYLTLYAFSTENWSRPAEEVSALMKLFHQYLEEALRDFMNENIRVRFIGDISAFAPDLQALIHRVEEASSVKTGMVLNLAMNYGGRAEITRAARILAERVKNGELYALGIHISPYEKGNIFNKDPLRVRKLLLHKKEILKISGKMKEQGITVVPLQVYFSGSLVKMEIGLAKGKKLYDKRDDIAKKDQKREAQREFKVRNL